MVSLEIQGHNTYFYVFFFSRVVCLPRIEMSIMSPEFGENNQQTKDYHAV
jgi:hypothetical protein